MYDLTELRERLRSQRPVPWDQLPDFSLYMDQVLSYMDRQVIRFDEDDGLTAAMVNNYTKSGLVPRAEGKKYSRDHLAYLTAICVLKRVMSTKDMDLLIREELQGDRPVSDGYAAFCASLLRNLTGLGSLMAFPGSMVGALLCGLVCRYTGNLKLTCVAEAFGTGVLGGIAAYPVAKYIVGSAPAGLFIYVVPFLISTVAGSILAFSLVTILEKGGVLEQLVPRQGRQVR